MLRILQGSANRSGLSAVLHGSENPSLFKAIPVPSKAPKNELSIARTRGVLE